MVDNNHHFGTSVPGAGAIHPICFGRIATKHVRTLLDRLWLQAAVRRIVIYVRLTFSSGNSDAEFLLLEALRTHGDEP